VSACLSVIPTIPWSTRERLNPVACDRAPRMGMWFGAAPIHIRFLSATNFLPETL
jgi:hypothetical protein